MNHPTATPTHRNFGNGQARHRSLRWPNGAGLAVSFVLNIEEGAEFSITSGDDHNEGVHEVVNRIDGVPDHCMETHFEYGARCGYRRVVDRFVERQLPLTLNVCGRALECTPWVAKEAVVHGFELCAHGWRWESPAHMDEVTERAAIARTAATIQRLARRGGGGVGACRAARLAARPAAGTASPAARSTRGACCRNTAASSTTATTTATTCPTPSRARRVSAMWSCLMPSTPTTCAFLIALPLSMPGIFRTTSSPPLTSYL